MRFPGLFYSTWHGWTRHLVCLSAAAGTHLIRHYLMLSLRAFSALWGTGIQLTKQTKRKEEKKKAAAQPCVFDTQSSLVLGLLYFQRAIVWRFRRPKVKFSLGRKLFCLMAYVCLNSSWEGQSHKTLKDGPPTLGLALSIVIPGRCFS